MNYKPTIDIPFGNASDFGVRTDGPVTEVSFAPEPRQGVEALWFCFGVERTGGEPAAGEQLRLMLKHGGNLLGHVPPENLRPVWRGDGGDWRRLPAGTFTKLAHGPWTLHWTVDAPRQAGQLAVCYPYGPVELDTLVRETGGYWHTNPVGITAKSRPLPRMWNKPGEEPPREPGVYLLARQHAGETPGSWVLDGLMRRLAEHGDAAPLTWVIPLSDVDGVLAGDYGKDSFPWDINRAWGVPPMRHETLTLQRDMRLWAAHCEPRFVLDLHAPGMCEGVGIYSFVRFVDEGAQADESVAASRAWAEQFGEALGEYAASNFCREATHMSKWTTWSCTRFVMEALGVPALTIEVPYALCGSIEMTPEHYRAAGARMADVIVNRCAR